MNTLAIFGSQLFLSLIVYGLLAKWYVVPWLARRNIYVALTVLAFPHTMRHVGLSFLVPGLVADSLHGSFAGLAAYGDFCTGLIALLSLVALRGRWRVALPLVWLFNIIGTMDLANALRQAESVPHLLSTWYIPTFFVPLLLVTHFMMFARLFQHALGRSSSCVDSKVDSRPRLRPACK